MNIPNVLHPLSPDARAIIQLFNGTLVLAVVIFVLVAGIIVFALIRYRAGRPGEARLDHGNPKLETVWTVIPILIVVVLFFFTVRTMVKVNAPTDPPRKPDIIITGHQWWWEVRYPQNGAVTANEIHIPVGKQLLVELRSADVIHSFWVPQLARKMDMVPGHPNHIWLQSDSAGTYLGACSEFCGAQHAWMRLRVIANPPAEFESWVSRQAQPAAQPTTLTQAEGSAVFTENTCLNCHTLRGLPGTRRVGPDLTHVASRQTLGAGVLESTPENLARWLRNPQAVKPGNHMPNLHLTDQQIQQLVAYLENLK